MHRPTMLLAAAALALGSCGPERAEVTDRPPAEMLMGSREQVMRLDGERADPFRIETLDGVVLDSESLLGSVVLVNFWATWCSPCVREMPDLAELARSLDDEAFVLIGAALEDPNPEGVRAFADRLDIPYPVAMDDGSLADALGGVYMMPTTYLLDREGRLVMRYIGVIDPDAVREDISRLLTSG